MRRIFAGNPFQSFGAADWNALSPSVAKHFPLGGVSDRLSHDLNLYLEFVFTDIRFTRYCGAKPFVHFNSQQDDLKMNSVFNG